MSVDTNKLNPIGSIELNLFSWEIPENLPEQEFKYENPQKVLDNIPTEMVILVQKMIKEVEKYDSRSVVVDYKVRNLKKGDTGSTLYGYHLDCCNDIRDEFEPETHILFSTVQGTSFVMNPIDISSYDTVQDVIKNEVLVELNGAINTAHKYTSKVLHNCPIIDQDCQRVLIRITAGFKERIKNAKAKQHQV